MLAALGSAFFVNLDGYPLRDTNEGLYAEVTRETLSRGHYLVPHLLGVPYIEKPPLLYWLMALSMHLFGVTASSARLVSSTAMATLCIAVFLFCHRQLGWRVGFYAFLVLCSAWPIALLSRTVLFDPLLTTLLSGALLCFFQWHVSGSHRWLRAAAACLALASLAKGGVAVVLAAGIAALFLWFMRDLAAMRRLADLRALMVFLLIALPWPVAACMAQDGFFWFYVVNEHLLRFLGMRVPRDFHTGPLYYYLLRLPVMMLPWTPFSLLALHDAGKQPKALLLQRFCTAWLTFPLLFYTASRAKGDYYLMVAAPAAAILAALAIERCRTEFRLRTFSACMAVVGAALALAGGLAWHAWTDSWSPAAVVMLHTGIVFGALLGWVAGYLSLKNTCVACQRIDLCIAAISALALSLLLGFLFQAEGQSQDKSSRNVALWIQSHFDRNINVYVYRRYEDAFSSLPFYLGKPVGVIESRSADLYFGCHHNTRVAMACVTPGAFQSLVAKEEQIVVVLRSDMRHFEALVAATSAETSTVFCIKEKCIVDLLPSGTYYEDAPTIAGMRFNNWPSKDVAVGK